MRNLSTLTIITLLFFILTGCDKIDYYNKYQEAKKEIAKLKTINERLVNQKNEEQLKHKQEGERIDMINKHGELLRSMLNLSDPSKSLD